MATQKTTLKNHAETKQPHPLVINQTITDEETAKGRASKTQKMPNATTKTFTHTSTTIIREDVKQCVTKKKKSRQ